MNILVLQVKKKSEAHREVYQFYKDRKWLNMFSVLDFSDFKAQAPQQYGKLAPIRT